MIYHNQHLAASKVRKHFEENEEAKKLLEQAGNRRFRIVEV